MVEAGPQPLVPAESLEPLPKTRRCVPDNAVGLEHAGSAIDMLDDSTYASAAPANDEKAIEEIFEWLREKENQ